MKNEMKPMPHVTLRYCSTDTLLIATEIACEFKTEYAKYPASDCVYTKASGISFYAKCTQSGNVTIMKL